MTSIPSISFTIAWLGEEDDDTHIAMELVETWATFEHIPDPFGELGDQPFGAAMLEPIKRVVPWALNSRANLALQALAKRPYWTRAWIYQELSWAKNVVVQCGRKSKPLERFLKARTGMKMLFPVWETGGIPEELSTVADIQRRPMAYMLTLAGSPRGIGPFSLMTLPFELLRRFMRLDATDPRDKVFAVLGFVALDGPLHNFITADYEKSTVQVYIDITRYLILTERTLHVLNERHL